MGLMAAAGFAAHSFAKFQAESRATRLRDYSSPEKWVEPNYASIKDMEAVCQILTISELVFGDLEEL